MKRLFAIFLSVMLCFSLAACGTDNSSVPTSSPESDVSVTESAPTDSDNSGPVQAFPDEIIATHAGTKEDPIPLGEWGEIPFFNSYDNGVVPIYARIVGVFPQSSESHMYETFMTEASENDDPFDLYEFESGWFDSFAHSDDLEGVIVRYELYLPEMTCLERGLADPSINLSPVTLEPIVGAVTGNTYTFDGISAYRLASAEMNLNQTYLPNNTYNGTCLYEMVTGAEDYLLCYEYTDLFSQDAETQYFYFSVK